MNGLDPVGLARRHAALLDQHLPGVLRGVYLVGSVALGDHRPGRSDVDTVTVVGRELVPADAPSLRAVHAALSPDAVGVAYDTTYVPVAWLAAVPSKEPVTPFSLDGVLHLDGSAFQVNPVTWVELGGSVAAVGPEPAELEVADVSEPLQQWLVQNLRCYWGPSAARMREELLTRPVDQEANPEAVAWHVLGAARLHATLTTGRILSKTEAGDHAASTWPRHVTLCRRAQAWRAGDDVRFTCSDGLEAADLVEAVVRDSPTSGRLNPS